VEASRPRRVDRSRLARERVAGGSRGRLIELAIDAHSHGRTHWSLALNGVRVSRHFRESTISGRPPARTSSPRDLFPGLYDPVRSRDDGEAAQKCHGPGVILGFHGPDAVLRYHDKEAKIQ